MFGAMLRRWHHEAKRKLELMRVPSVEKATGLAELSDENFLWLAANAVVSLEDPGLAWNSRPLGLLAEKRINHQGMNRFVEYLRPWLRGSRVYEIGAADTGELHESVLKSRFGVSEYRAVDPMPDLDPVVEEGDVLRFLSEQDAGSGHVLALGLFEPRFTLEEFLEPAPDLLVARPEHYQHEYVRRLVKELSRVIPHEGLLFGDGLGSGRKKGEVELYLERAGFSKFEAPARLLKEGAALFPELNGPKGPVEPFFFKRVGK